MEKEKIFVTARCPIRTTLELIGGKWKLIIMQQLIMNSELRFFELKELIPDISEKMLIQELKTLAISGLVHRKNYGEVPPRVGYRITKKGSQAESLIKEMVKFARNYEEIGNEPI